MLTISCMFALFPLTPSPDDCQLAAPRLAYMYTGMSCGEKKHSLRRGRALRGVRGGDRVRHLGRSTRDGEGWEQKDKGWSLSLLFPSTHSFAPILSRSTLSFHLSFLSLLFILLLFLPILFLLVLSLTLIFLTLLYTLKLFIHLVSLAVVPPNIIPLYLPSLSLLSRFLPFPSYWLPGSHI